MSEIRDKAKIKMWKIIDNCKGDPAVDIPDIILSIPELAIVDREAGLPENPYASYRHYETLAGRRHADIGNCAYSGAQQDMLKAGYVKEIKD